MRMRRKKHREERLDACKHVLVENIYDYAHNMSELFTDDRPIHMEIGCGKGRFICETAKITPHTQFLAVEKNLDVCVLAAERIVREGLNNLKIIPGDARFLQDTVCEHWLDRIYLNFSDPWPKARTAKRRLTHKGYLQQYKKALRPGGALFLKTDNRALFEFSLNEFCDFGLRLKNISLDLHNSDFQGNIMTEYEEMFSAEGKPIYRCEAVFTV